MFAKTSFRKGVAVGTRSKPHRVFTTRIVYRQLPWKSLTLVPRWLRCPRHRKPSKGSVYRRNWLLPQRHRYSVRFLSFSYSSQESSFVCLFSHSKQRAFTFSFLKSSHSFIFISSTVKLCTKMLTRFMSFTTPYCKCTNFTFDFPWILILVSFLYIYITYFPYLALYTPSLYT